jgi:hypothetical protein
MTDEFLESLNNFIVRAKAATYVGSGEHTRPCRPGSHDLQFSDGEWSYLDSYFGGRDFIGQEVVYHAGKPVWAMNYYGYILRDDLITPEQAGRMIKASLSHMYREGRFLGGYQHTEGELTYADTSEGTPAHFHGQETIRRGQIIAYELIYHGGLVKD